MQKNCQAHHSPGPFPLLAEEGPGEDLKHTSDENKAQQVGFLGALFVLRTKDHCKSSFVQVRLGLETVNVFALQFFLDFESARMSVQLRNISW